MSYTPCTPGEHLQMVQWVTEILGPEKAKIWWTVPNPLLANVSPQEFLNVYQERKLYNFIQDAKENNDAAHRFRDAADARGDDPARAQDSGPGT